MSLFEIVAYASIAVLIIALIVPSVEDRYEYLWQK